jgi:hypothetical protein
LRKPWKPAPCHASTGIETSMPIPGNLLTTAMAVMPHSSVDRAREVALSLDILSLDVYTNGEVFSSYSSSIRRFLDREYLLSRSLLSPATCCLVNPHVEKTVERAFETIKQLSETLREKYRLR